MGCQGWEIKDCYHQSWPEHCGQDLDKMIVQRTWLSQHGGVQPFNAKSLRKMFDVYFGSCIFEHVFFLFPTDVIVVVEMDSIYEWEPKKPALRQEDLTHHHLKSVHSQDPFKIG
jgi:hypothetical protein